jgi:predicted secreted protein
MSWKPVAVLVAIVAIAFLGMLIPSTEVLVNAPCDSFAEHDRVVREVEASMWVDSLILEICSNQTTGFAWELTDTTNDSVVRLLGTEYIPTDAEGQVGAGGSEVWTFSVRQRGEVTISMEYSQPWEGGEKAARSFELVLIAR